MTTRMRVNRRFKVAVALMAAALVTAGCTTTNGSSESTTAAAATTSKAPAASSGASEAAGSGAGTTEKGVYKLGLGLPLTGPAAAYGEEYRHITEMGIAAANEQYAADGIELQLVVEDTQATAEGGVSAMNKLGAVEQVPMVLTAWSGVVSAAAPVAQDLGFALVNAGAQSPGLIGLSPNLMNILPMNDSQLAGLVKYITQDLKITKVATIYTDNESGQGTAKVFEEQIVAAGGTVVAAESIRQDATDASTQISKVMAAEPEFVYIQPLLVEGSAILKSARELGLNATLGSYAGVGESRLIRDAGQDKMNGLIYMSHMPPDVPAVKKLLDEYAGLYPGAQIVNQSYDPYFYATPFLMAEAIKALRASGTEVTGASLLAYYAENPVEVPIIGTMDLTDRLTFRAPTVLKKVTDWQADPLEDEIIAEVALS